QQNPEAQFCTLTVEDEVAFGLENRRLPRDEIRARLAWALDIVNAAHLRTRTLATLSGGEKQKVAVAAMMATRPQVLIFDEPTSNLDPTATMAIFDVIARIREEAGVTVIVIEHKVDYLQRFSPRYVTMAEGRITDYELRIANYELQTIEGKTLGFCEHRIRGETGDPDSVAKLTHVYAGYNEHAVLCDLSLSLKPGELVAVMGDNGAGKTTLLQTLLGLLKPAQGTVEVLGKDTRYTSVSRLARQVGFVFQNPDHQLFAETVWQEATFAPRNFGALNADIEVRTRDLLARAGLEDRHADPPYRLSYGEKRRLNLISVLSYAPRLLLLDEIFIGQDPANVAFMLALLREYVTRGNTAVLVNHNPEISKRYAGRVLLLNKGQLV
ncbi:MAG: ABC transporter ATP-binding protein, partial [Anaerolineae bacterium]|nr:ABC transporter ATP-binding protein [Anaerolineae bacterium]